MKNYLHPGPTTDATGAVVQQLMTKYAAPAEVAGAADVAPAPVAANYADHNGARQYPVHTAKAAWVAAAFYHHGGSTDPRAAQRIKRACEYFRLRGEWERLEKAARPRPAPAPTHYALPAAGKYPLDTPDDLTKAAGYFESYCDRLPPDDRREYAANVVKAAGRLGADLGADRAHRFEAEAGLGRLADDWASAFAVRAKLAEANGLDELCGYLKEAAAGGGLDDPVAAAAVLRSVDAVNGWKCRPPLDVLVADTPSKVARELGAHVRAADGAWYKRADLAAVPDAAVSALFGAPVVVSAETRGGLLKEAATCARFREVLADHGVQPVEAPRRRVDWAALAAAG